MHTIVGKSNTLLREIRAAFKEARLVRDQLLAIEGPHLLAEALKASRRVVMVLCSERGRGGIKREKIALQEATRTLEISDRLLDSVCDTESHQGILALIEMPRWDRDPLLKIPDAVFLCLAGIQDPGNLGTLLRSADAFGATAVFTTDHAAHWFHPKTVRASGGAIFRVATFEEKHSVHLLDLLNRHKIFSIASSPQATTTLENHRFQFPCALWLGAEAHGLPRAVLERVPQRVSISMQPNVESLNVAMAGSILLHETFRQKKAAVRRELVQNL